MQINTSQIIQTEKDQKALDMLILQQSEKAKEYQQNQSEGGKFQSIGDELQEVGSDDDSDKSPMEKLM